MRKSIWIVLAMLAAGCAPCAKADTIIDGTLNVTVTTGSPDATGSFVYDDTTDTLESYTVDWDGVTYNYTSLAAGDPLAVLEDAGTWCGAGIANSYGLCDTGQFDVSAIGYDSSYTGTFMDLGNDAASGTYTVSATTETTGVTPEPSSWVLMLLGLGALLAMRRRLGEGRRLAVGSIWEC